jgi:hypothetical protein
LDFYDATGDWADGAETDSSGHYIGGGLEPGGYFVATDPWSGYQNEVYDDHPCSGRHSSDCNVLAGELVQVSLHSTTTGVDFALDRLGGFAGTVLGGDTMLPIASLEVSVWTATDERQDWVPTSALGTYVAEDLYPSEYFATTDGDTGYLDELYDDLPCPGGAPDGCDPTMGDPVIVTLASFTTGIDFELLLRGGLAGTVEALASGQPLSGVASAWSRTTSPVD